MPAIICDSPLGRLFLEEKDGGLCRLQVLASEERKTSSEDPPTELLDEARCQLAAYFAGKLRRFDLPLNMEGTAFQHQVWASLRSIGYGTVKTYGDIAREVGSPFACRAVGMACHRNPVPIVVPCHRVVGVGGKLTGFAYGVEVKRFLLGLEKTILC